MCHRFLSYLRHENTIVLIIHAQKNLHGRQKFGLPQNQTICYIVTDVALWDLMETNKKHQPLIGW